MKNPALSAWWNIPRKKSGLLAIQNESGKGEQTGDVSRLPTLPREMVIIILCVQKVELAITIALPWAGQKTCGDLMKETLQIPL